MKQPYRKIYQECHDIDWFAICNNVPIHVASNGGNVPSQIKSRDNRTVQKYLANIEVNGNNDIRINQDWLNELELLEQNDDGIAFDGNTYLHTFVEFAQLGFVSIDNAIINEEYHCRIVAFPQNRNDLFKMNNIELPEIPLNELAGVDLNVWKEK